VIILIPVYEKIEKKITLISIFDIFAWIKHAHTMKRNHSYSTRQWIILQVCILVIIPGFISAQYQDRIWVFGRPYAGSSNATLNFGNQPVPSGPIFTLPNGQPSSISTSNGNEQWAVVVNPFTGNVIFYTDGKQVFDHVNAVIPSIDLGANVSSVQPVAIAPVPRSDLKAKNSYNLYYIFSNGTGSFFSSFVNGNIVYHIYDYVNQTFSQTFTLPGPYGTADVTEGMKIIPCDNNPDVLWLVTSLFPYTGLTTKYVVYKIDKNVVTYHGDFDFGPAKAPLNTGASPIIYITYSRAGTPAGITNVGFASQYPPAVFTCQFDNINGAFLPNTVKTCNTGYTSSIPSIYTCEFSPNGRFLYYSVYRTTATTNALFQVDLTDSVLTPTQVKSFNYPYAGGLKQGPDSLIYHVHDDGYETHAMKIGRILTPNQKFIPGTTPINQFYQENFQIYNNVFGIGLCEFLVIPYTVQIGTDDFPAAEGLDLQLYPNPADDFLHLRLNPEDAQGGTIILSDLHGKQIISVPAGQTRELEIPTGHLPEGVYLLHCITPNRTNLQKVMIAH